MEDSFGPNFVSLIDEESGKEIELEFLDALEYNGVLYRLFYPVLEEGEEADEEAGLIILKSEESGGEEVLVQIEDEDELNAVYDQFMEQIFEDDE